MMMRRSTISTLRLESKEVPLPEVPRSARLSLRDFPEAKTASQRKMQLLEHCVDLGARISRLQRYTLDLFGSEHWSKGWTTGNWSLAEFRLMTWNTALTSGEKYLLPWHAATDCMAVRRINNEKIGNLKENMEDRHPLTSVCLPSMQIRHYITGSELRSQI